MERSRDLAKELLPEVRAWFDELDKYSNNEEPVLAASHYKEEMERLKTGLALVRGHILCGDIKDAEFELRLLLGKEKTP